MSSTEGRPPEGIGMVLAIARDSATSIEFREALSARDYLVLVAPSPDELSSVMRVRPPHIVLLDASLSDVPMAVRAIRSSLSPQGPPRVLVPRLLAVVPQLHRSTTNWCRDMGLHDCIARPLSWERIVAAWRRTRDAQPVGGE